MKGGEIHGLGTDAENCSTGSTGSVRLNARLGTRPKQAISLSKRNALADDGQSLEVYAVRSE